MLLIAIELLHSSMQKTRNAPIQIARFTGSLRRNSSCAWASANKLMRIGIGSNGCEGCPHCYAQLRRYMLHFRHLLRWERHLQKTQRVPRFAFQHQMSLQVLYDKLRSCRATADKGMRYCLVVL